MENIYERLANGESSDAIAAEFTAALNEAMARHAKDEEEKAAKAEAERLARLEKEAKSVQKREDMVDVLNHAFRYVAKHYPELGIAEGDWDDEELRAIAELCIVMLDLEVLKAKSKRPLVESTETVPHPRTTLPVKVSLKSEKPVSTDDIFADFFKSLGL